VSRPVLAAPVVFALPLALACCACAARSAPPGTVPSAPVFGVYKSVLHDAEGESHRFRLLLWAAHPDRLHAEVLAPLGQTRLIVDGGAGEICVTVVPEAVSYAGEAGAEALERILGIRIGLEELVQALMGTRSSGDGYTVERSGGRSRLPDRVEFRTGAAGLRLVLKDLRALAESAEPLGSGTPPPGTRVRPLEELRGSGSPSLVRGEGSGS
jgi:hypothetical protein